jgi:hypothetical protein
LSTKLTKVLWESFLIFPLFEYERTHINLTGPNLINHLADWLWGEVLANRNIWSVVFYENGIRISVILFFFLTED